MKNEEFAAAIARGLCAAPLRDYASNACGKPALDGNFSSPPKLGGVPNGGGGLTRREDKDKNQQSDRPLRPLGGTSPNLGEELR